MLVRFPLISYFDFVTFLNRFRPCFLFVAAAPAVVGIYLLGPIDYQVAFLLILYGSWIGEIHGRLNSRPDSSEDVHPWLPWKRLGAGEKLEYLLPTVITIGLGLLVTIGMLFVGGAGIKYWLTLAGGLCIIALGSWDLRRRWLNRWAFVESE